MAQTKESTGGQIGGHNFSKTFFCKYYQYIKITNEPSSVATKKCDLTRLHTPGLENSRYVNNSSPYFVGEYVGVILIILQ